jgi:hypothetical protein
MTEETFASSKGRIYFIGHRDLGVLMVHEGKSGLKVNRIPKEAIDTYAAAKKVLPDSVFAEIASVLSYVSTVADAKRPVDPAIRGEVESAKAIGEAVASNVLGGVQVSSADFCFVTEILEEQFGVGRYSIETSPIANIMQAFESPALGNLGEIKPSTFDK